MASTKRKLSQDETLGSNSNDAAEAGVTPMSVQETYIPERRSSSNDLMIGEILKRERERRGYDLQQIADYLCIRRGLLSAIENGRYEEFPADAYVIGFLRSYAELIGLNGQDAINRYRQEMAGRRRKPDLVLPTPISEGRAPTAVIIGGAVLASLLIYILWYAFSTSDRATVTTPPTLPTTTADSSATLPSSAVPVATETLAASTPSGIAIAAPAPASAPMQSTPPAATASDATTTAASAPAASDAASAAAAPQQTSAPHILIKAEQSSWVLISNAQGKTIYDHVMKPGETYQVPNFPGLTLTAGNGAGIVIALDGVDLPKLSNVTSHIVRNVPLDTATLKSLPKPND